MIIIQNNYFAIMRIIKRAFESASESAFELAFESAFESASESAFESAFESENNFFAVNIAAYFKKASEEDETKLYKSIKPFVTNKGTHRNEVYKIITYFFHDT